MSGIRNSVALSLAGVAGMTSTLLVAGPAHAEAVSCDSEGSLVSGSICELTFTGESATFSPTPAMDNLEALLVGGGGTSSYAHGGGGGEVTLVGFDADVAPLSLQAGGATQDSTITDGTTTSTAHHGVDGNSDEGGASGSGMAGAHIDTLMNDPAAGGGAGASPLVVQDGGVGVVVSTLATTDSPFRDDEDCFGGGGGVGNPTITGIATCGGGQPDYANLPGFINPAPGSGGGGGGWYDPGSGYFNNSGATGRVTFRWFQLATLTFDTGSHGDAVSPQTIRADEAPVVPTAPTAEGFQFTGWYTDAALTVPADFSAPLGVNTTFYAAWTPVLANTGAGDSLLVLLWGCLATVVGSLVTVLVYRRKRSS